MSVIVGLFAYAVAAAYLWFYVHIRYQMENATFDRNFKTLCSSVKLVYNDYTHAYLRIIDDRSMRRTLFIAFFSLFVVPVLFSDGIVLAWITCSLGLLGSLVLYVKRTRINPMVKRTPLEEMQVEVWRKAQRAEEVERERTRIGHLTIMPRKCSRLLFGELIGQR